MRKLTEPRRRVRYRCQHNPDNCHEQRLRRIPQRGRRFENRYHRSRQLLHRSRRRNYCTRNRNYRCNNVRDLALR